MFTLTAEFFTMEEVTLSQWKALIKLKIDKLFQKNQPDVCPN